MSPQFNAENAKKLAQLYFSKPFDQVHQSVSQLISVVDRLAINQKANNVTLTKENNY